MNGLFVKKQFITNRNRHSQLLFCVGILLILPSSAFAIDIEETIWGFNNQQSKGMCIPLSLKLSNNTPEVFDELVQLNRLQYSGSKVGAPLCRKIFLAPYSSQWVQFYPYIIDERQDEWSLNWGPRFIYSRKFSRNGAAYKKTPNAKAPLSRIVLTSSNSLSQSGSRFKRYPEELFPPMVTATDSLDEVILDHVPRWDTARKESFMDWLYRGGTLHLLPDSSGANLNFTTSMANLNTPQDHFRVGSGLIIRHQGKLTQLTESLIESKVQDAHAEESPAVAPAQSTTKENKQATTQQEDDSYYFGDVNAKLLQTISEMTRPDHNWSIIYVMTGFYILLIYPGCYLFNKKQKSYHYRNSLLFLLITVALFSTVFWSIGKRGYGETTTINSLVIASPLEGDQYDLKCWVNTFVTSGAEYQFSSAGNGIIFTTAQEAEKVRGAIFNGLDGSFYSDIPPFSARSFMYRIKAPYKEQNIKVIDYEVNTNSELTSLLIEASSALPDNISKVQVMYDLKIYELKQSEEDARTYWVLGNGRRPLSAWKSKLMSNATNARRYGYQNEEIDTSKVYDGLYEIMVMRNLNLIRPSQLNQYQGEKARIKLFLYCDIPEEFKLKTNVQGVQQGRVLFAYDLPLPEKKIDKK
ncbi:hypothetical protein [uncultured Gimesia sp.]|uniref:hypothetical protein n=1 Tax=uncultured Gimesia sp. TaxID=1678688 RepID=UPI0030DA90C6|tara:strand:- start:153052 stop:154962 length:1911 start_codon:yes stop_codon:yes gene_type:complete